MQQDEDERKKQENANTLEKLMKLDKKHSNFDIIDNQLNIKLKVRNVQPNSNSMLSSVQSEYSIRFFWKYISTCYFRRIEDHEQERLNYLQALLNSTFREPKEIYNDMDSILSYDSVVDFKELKQTYIISLLVFNIWANKGQNKWLQEISMKKFQSQPRNIKKKNQEAILADEQKKLDLLLEQIQQVDQDDEEEDEELESLKQELKQLNKQNKQGVQNLIDKVKQESQYNALIYIENNFQGNFIKRTGTEKQRKELVYQINSITAPENLTPQQEFLKKTILKQEAKQVAESIVLISNVKKQLRSNFVFEIFFEEAINPKSFWITEEQVQYLNSLLETLDHDLLRFYNIPQKTLYSHICNNFEGAQLVYQNRNKINNLKDNMLEIIKKRAENEIDHEIKREFDACHQCKCLFNVKYLVKCNYRSSTMGLPATHASCSDSLMISQMDLDSNSSRLMHRKRNGELVCRRKYCRDCLKQYDQKLTDIIYKPEWICPFCRGICQCSRCLKNDSIAKLKSLYMLLGGNVNLIAKESLLEIYLRPSDEERKNFSQMMHKDKIDEQTKKQIKEFSKLGKIRINLEKLRLLACQIQTREKIKTIFLKQNIELLNQEHLAIDQSYTKKNFHCQEVNEITEEPIKKKKQKISEEKLIEIIDVDKKNIKQEEMSEKKQILEYQKQKKQQLVDLILLRSNKLYKIITNPNEPPVEMKSKNGGVKRELHHLLQDQNIEYLEEFYRLQTKISKNKK